MLKENLLWIRPFATVLELVEALRKFKRRYNEQWLIERHGFRTPSQVRAELTGRAGGRVSRLPPRLGALTVANGRMRMQRV
jgi:hypothetical protein